MIDLIQQKLKEKLLSQEGFEMKSLIFVMILFFSLYENFKEDHFISPKDKFFVAGHNGLLVLLFVDHQKRIHKCRCKK